MSITSATIKGLARRFMKIYGIDESMLHEVIDIAIFARENINIKPGAAVHIAALYVLARRGVDIVKYMPRHARKRAKIAILEARMIAAKENRDDVDEFIRAYSYAIYLAAKHSLPPEVLERAREELWNLRYRINGDPLACANFVLHNAMSSSSQAPATSVPCTRKVKVKTEAGEVELVPKKVWTVSIDRGCGNPFKLGLFVDPQTGKRFRAGVPPDYPDCS